MYRSDTNSNAKNPSSSRKTMNFIFNFSQLPELLDNYSIFHSEILSRRSIRVSCGKLT